MPGAREVITDPLTGAIRHRRLSPPVLVTVPVVPPGAGVGDGVPGVAVGVGPPLTVRYWAETNPFCPAHRTGYQPLDNGPRTSTWVPGPRETITAPDTGAVRQRRLSPPVLLTVPNVVPGGAVDVGETFTVAVWVGPGVIGAGVVVDVDGVVVTVAGAVTVTVTGIVVGVTGMPVGATVGVTGVAVGVTGVGVGHGPSVSYRKLVLPWTAA